MGGNQYTMRWFGVIAPLNYLVGAAMVAVGVYLLRPSLIDLGFYVEAGRYEVVSVFLFYAAFVLVAATLMQGRGSHWVADILTQFLWGPGALLGTMLIEFVLAGTAMFSTPPNWYVAAFGIPALFTLAMLINADIDAIRRRSAQQNDETTTTETGKSPGRGYLLGFLIGGVAAAVLIFPLIIWLAIGFALYYTMDAVLFDGAERSLAWFISVVPQVLSDALPRALPPALALVTVLPLVGVVIAVVNWVSKGGRSAVDRDLTPEEIAFVERAHGDLQSYIEARGYTNKWPAIALVAVPFLTAILVPTALLLAGHDWIVATFYEPDRVRGLSWFIYSDDVGPATVAILFAGIFAAWSLLYVVCHLWPYFAERTTAAASEDSKRDRLVFAVRRGLLEIAEPFDPRRFLAQWAVAYEHFVHVATAALALFAAVLWHHDRNSYDLITEDYIQTVDYWTLKATRFGYGEVREMRIECLVDDKGSLDIAYDVVLPSDAYARMIVFMHFKRDFDNFVRVDEKLRMIGKPATFATRKPWFKDLTAAYQPECVARLAEKYPAEKVERLFHLEDWYREQWRRRTSPP